jgi:hypothetical protein
VRTAHSGGGGGGGFANGFEAQATSPTMHTIENNREKDLRVKFIKQLLYKLKYLKGWSEYGYLPNNPLFHSMVLKGFALCGAGARQRTLCRRMLNT